jgi:large subunit ribosomal protein L35
MPKIKTHSGAKKRFRQTARGKLRGRHGMTSHIRVKKNAKRQRRLDAPAVISDADRPRVERLLRK